MENEDADAFCEEEEEEEEEEGGEHDGISRGVRSTNELTGP